ncbi:MAG: proline dehydrogenase, partial [Alphaproteobacteria bacterium]
MQILGMKPGHDGAFALLQNAELKFSFEAEKNSFLRFPPISPSSLLDAAGLCDGIPDCIALGGWSKGPQRADFSVGAGYLGVGREHARIGTTKFFGKQVTLFEGTHESSHIWCSYGLSPFAGTFPCYALVWEGRIGRFYCLNEDGSVTAYPQVMVDPGGKYVFMFMLADPSYVD